MTTKNVLLFKFHCNIFIGVRIIKEMPGSVASGTPCSNRNFDKAVNVLFYMKCRNCTGDAGAMLPKSEGTFLKTSRAS